MLLRFDLIQFSHVQTIGRITRERHSGKSPQTHDVVRSSSTSDGRYFSINMGGQPAMNPNIIPHPFLEDTWILVAQLRQQTQHFAELVCNAKFEEGVMKCISGPSKLPIAPTFGDKCTGVFAYIELNQGPHDARVFYGPDKPYTIYGSNSEHTCFGQWIHDFRNLIEWGFEEDDSHKEFLSATELQRPPPWSAIEKNWFLFWDLDGHIYAHYDVVPNRVFARVENSGAVGPDMGLATRSSDEACMARIMPEVGQELESIHQATNSLSITMCKRNDRSCTPNISNTFVFTVFQHKKYYNFHAVYEPYILMFEQVPPFKVSAISTKPFWIYGRKIPLSQSLTTDGQKGIPNSLNGTKSDGEEMLYITSMSWKDRGQTYHGYMDDVLFISFGIEDEETAAIDVLAGELMQNLHFC